LLLIKEEYYDLSFPSHKVISNATINRVICVTGQDKETTKISKLEATMMLLCIKITTNCTYTHNTTSLYKHNSFRYPYQIPLNGLCTSSLDFTVPASIICPIKNDATKDKGNLRECLQLFFFYTNQNKLSHASVEQ